MVIEMMPASQAGGITNWARWPVGKVSDTTGSTSVMRWPVLLSLTTAVQNCRARSKVSDGTSIRCQLPRLSRYSSPGRLMQISVTSGEAMYSRTPSTSYW